MKKMTGLMTAEPGCGRSVAHEHERAGLDC